MIKIHFRIDNRLPKASLALEFEAPYISITISQSTQPLLKYKHPIQNHGSASTPQLALSNSSQSKPTGMRGFVLPSRTFQSLYRIILLTSFLNTYSSVPWILHYEESIISTF